MTLCITNIQPLKLNMSDHMQEEADTLMVVYANYMASENPSQELYILSPDTDILLLLIYNYPSLCSKTIFMTGKFCRKSKALCWKKFLAANKSMLEGLHALGEDENLPGNRIINDIEKFV